MADSKQKRQIIQRKITAINSITIKTVERIMMGSDFAGVPDLCSLGEYSWKCSVLNIGYRNICILLDYASSATCAKSWSEFTAEKLQLFKMYVMALFEIKLSEEGYLKAQSDGCT